MVFSMCRVCVCVCVVGFIQLVDRTDTVAHVLQSFKNIQVRHSIPTFSRCNIRMTVSEFLQTLWSNGECTVWHSSRCYGHIRKELR